MKQETFEKIKSLVQKTGFAAEINPESKPADVGLDSLALADLAFDLEDAFNIKISEESFTSLRNNAEVTLKDIGDLIDSILEQK
jgi:acyl carrier protein